MATCGHGPRYAPIRNSFPSWLSRASGPYDDAWVFFGGAKGSSLRQPCATHDGRPPGSHLTAIGLTFGREIDYAQLQKGSTRTDPKGHTRTSYSPPVCTGTQDPRVLRGNPDPSRISTSYVERQNLTMRMGMRRFTRLTNGFSKKVENLQRTPSALHYMHYNFARPPQDARRIHIRAPRAMAAGVDRSRVDARARSPNSQTDTPPAAGRGSVAQVASGALWERHGSPARRGGLRACSETSRTHRVGACRAWLA